MTGSCAVVIPARNEELSIARVVAEIRDEAPVIVVDDASTDGTAAAAVKAGAVVVSHGSNRGYGAAIATGFREAVARGFRWVITMDGDGQHDPSHVVQFRDLLARDAYDLVIGIRPRPARLAERAFAWYTRVRFGIVDPFCGVKGYDVRLFIEYGDFDRHRSVGTELMLYGIRRHARWTQVPIRLRPRLDGHARYMRVGDEHPLRTAIRANLHLLRAVVAATRVR
jgi:glycosyltransferase involved in cell wall biosynthesis